MAYSLLSEELRHQRPLKLIGQGPLYHELQRQAKKLGLLEVDFLGWTQGEALTQALYSSKVVCLPSREESFGRLIPNCDAKTLATQLAVELNCNRDRKESQAQRDYIRRRYSWQVTAQQFLALY